VFSLLPWIYFWPFYPVYRWYRKNRRDRTTRGNPDKAFAEAERKRQQRREQLAAAREARRKEPEKMPVAPVEALLLGTFKAVGYLAREARRGFAHNPPAVQDTAERDARRKAFAARKQAIKAEPRPWERSREPGRSR
jgi:hypothetical protein